MNRRDDRQTYPEGENRRSSDEISLSTEDYVIISEVPGPVPEKDKTISPAQINYALPIESDPYIGNLIQGRYEVQSLIGVGGMGRVYKAHQHSVDRYVAIKILPAGPGMDKQVAKRFQQEARAASRLCHPNTITVHDFGQIKDGSLYIVMEFLTGHTLEYVIQEQPSVARVLRIALQICGSLAEAHKAGIIHRDLKPPNIIVSAIGEDKDWVKVVDVGIAKLGNTASLTVAGTVSGTPEYMSPEQVQGKTVDARSDIYSLGLLMYELLTGSPVVTGNTPLACMYAHIHSTPLPFSEAAPHRATPMGLERVVLKMLAKDPEGRFQSIPKLMPLLNDLLLEEVTRRKSAPLLTTDSFDRSSEDEITAERQTPIRPVPPSSEELQILEDLAKLYEQRGEPEQATETYRKIAGRLINNNAYKEATKALKAALALSPSDEASRQMIESCFAILDRRRSKHPEDGRPSPPPQRHEVEPGSVSDFTQKKMLATRLELAVQEQQFQQALSLIRKTLAEEPSNAIAIEYAGHIYETVGDNVLDQDEIIWLKALLGKATDKGARRPVFSNTDSFETEHHLVTIDGGTLESVYGGVFEVESFALQMVPVTNGDYHSFVHATGELPPPHWLGPDPPAAMLELPVVNVSLSDARKYAEWCSMRLPTIVEWEAAARLPDNRGFPWGNEWDPERCHCKQSGATAPGMVGQHPAGASHFGCQDLMGNVWEWTERHDEMPSPEPGYFWVMGGSFKHPCVKNGHIARTDVSEYGVYPYLGFRCARSTPRKKR